MAMHTQAPNMNKMNKMMNLRRETVDISGVNLLMGEKSMLFLTILMEI